MVTNNHFLVIWLGLNRWGYDNHKLWSITNHCDENHNHNIYFFIIYGYLWLCFFTLLLKVTLNGLVGVSGDQKLIFYSKRLLITYSYYKLFDISPM